MEAVNEWNRAEVPVTIRTYFASLVRDLARQIVWLSLILGAASCVKLAIEEPWSVLFMAIAGVAVIVSGRF